MRRRISLKIISRIGKRSAGARMIYFFLRTRLLSIVPTYCVTAEVLEPSRVLYYPTEPFCMNLVVDHPTHRYRSVIFRAFSDIKPLVRS